MEFILDMVCHVMLLAVLCVLNFVSYCLYVCAVLTFAVLCSDRIVYVQALNALQCLSDSEAKQCLEGMVAYVLDRLY